jgi:EAL domain-containing protein (putative c-di-GMP-specific phosphodiesterase class I)
VHQTLRIAAPQPESGGVIFVKGDDEHLAQRVMRLFEASCSRVIIVDSSSAALEHLLRSAFDAVFCDVDLREGSGVDALSTLRAYAPGVPLVLVGELEGTSPTRPELLDRIAKPATDAALSEALQRAREIRRRSTAITNHPPSRRVSHVARARRQQSAFDYALDSLFVDLEPIVDVTQRYPLGFEACIGSRVDGLHTRKALIDRAHEVDRGAELLARSQQVVAKAFLQAPESSLLFLEVSPSDLLAANFVYSEQPFARFRGRVVFTLSSQIEVTDELAWRVGCLRREEYLFAVREVFLEGESVLRSDAVSRLAPEFLKMDSANVRGIHQHPDRQIAVANLVATCNERGVIALAQGLNTAEEQSVLQSLGCALVQGPLVRRHALRSSRAPSVARRSFPSLAGGWRAPTF